MGFRASSHAIYPCCICNVGKNYLGNLMNVALDHGPSDTFTDDMYRDLVAACSIVVQISDPSDVKLVIDAGLDFAKKHLGRTLRRHVVLSSGARLLPGDRLHPSRSLRDVADFERMRPFRPFTCVFWRVANPKTARLLHRSPLMDIPGVGMHSYAIDILHTWHLGGIPRYCGRVLWLILRSDAYGADLPMWLAAEDQLHLKLLRLRSALWVHYTRMQAADPEWSKRASQVWILTLKMLGKELNPHPEGEGF
jgi:hypothetical protein